MSLFNTIFNNNSETDTGVSPVFEIHKNKVYPWIKSTLNDPDGQLKPAGNDPFISANWLGDLVILYVFDTGHGLQFLRESELPRQITAAELHRMAVKNLNKDIQYNLHDADFGGYGLTTGGNHETDAVCLTDMWTWLSENFNASLVVAMPAKDIILFVPEHDNDKISNLKIMVHEYFRKEGAALTRHIFRFDKNTLEWTIIDNIK